ncbi:MAG: hypothetical protein [Bacteriophage sp.]|nr:MAG: hypothetical protein [Bacteriophage sp.]
MTVKSTSWSAYQEITRGGVAKTQAEKVFQTLQYYPDGASRAELSKDMDMPINAVCGRINELLKADVIYVASVSKCPVSGRNVEKLKAVSYE